MAMNNQPKRGIDAEAVSRGAGRIQNSHTSPETLWSVQDAADFTGMSESWIYRKAAAGHIPRLYIGSRLRFVPEELKEWALSQRGANALAQRISGRADA
jgi:excisionase family DNA binding protein